MRKQQQKNTIPSQLILLIMIIVCLVLLFASYLTDFSGGPLNVVSNYIFVPMQSGLDTIGGKISANNDSSKTKEELIAENEELQSQVDQLNQQIINMQLQQSELSTLQELYDLDQTLDYKTTGAHIISSGTSNWFDTFTIDKGSSDGIQVDMNVIADGGLVGIVTSVGKHYSICRAIIDDTSNISTTIVSTGDNCISSGSLEMMTENNEMLISSVDDQQDQVKVGDAVVTSNISDKYQPGILVGYIASIENDDNGLTKSGTIVPVVDFKHLSDVLIVLDLKEVSD